MTLNSELDTYYMGRYKFLCIFARVEWRWIARLILTTWAGINSYNELDIYYRVGRYKFLCIFILLYMWAARGGRLANVCPILKAWCFLYNLRTGGRGGGWAVGGRLKIFIFWAHTKWMSIMVYDLVTYIFINRFLNYKITYGVAPASRRAVLMKKILLINKMCE